MEAGWAHLASNGLSKSLIRRDVRSRTEFHRAVLTQACFCVVTASEFEEFDLDVEVQWVGCSAIIDNGLSEEGIRRVNVDCSSRQGMQIDYYATKVRPAKKEIVDGRVI
jgi:hypothetical protein